MSENDKDDFSKLATDNLTKLIEEYGSTSTTVKQFLGQFGYSELTSESADEVWEALRDAGLREDPLLSKPGLTPETKLTIRRIETKREKEDKSFITWGFITAVLLAPVGIFFGIRLLIRDRVGPGLAVIFTAVILWGAGIVIVLGQRDSGPAAQNFNAHNPNLQNKISQAIENKSTNGITVSGVSCVAASNSAMTCLGSETSSYGNGQETYTVTVDTNTGHYIISSPRVSLNNE